MLDFSKLPEPDWKDEKFGVALYRGDCLEIMPKIECQLDMCMTDPPYGTTACKWDSVIDIPLMWESLKRLVKINGAIALMGSEPFSSTLRVSNLNMYKFDWKFIKNNSTGFLNAKKQPLRNNEDVMMFYRLQPTYNPQKKVISGGKTRNLVKSNRPCQGGDYVYRKDIEGVTWKDDATRYPLTTILNLYDKERFDSTKATRLHPTQKPVALMEYMIKTYTDEGDSVLDFSMGSGTTGVAAVNLGRSFIGIELDEDYFKIAVDRIKQTIIDAQGGELFAEHKPGKDEGGLFDD